MRKATTVKKTMFCKPVNTKSISSGIFSLLMEHTSYIFTENVWGTMTGELTSELNGLRTTPDQLWEHAEAAWARITPALWRRLADPMEDRL